jgi:hypothetical protein
VGIGSQVSGFGYKVQGPHLLRQGSPHRDHHTGITLPGFKTRG